MVIRRHVGNYPGGMASGFGENDCVSLLRHTIDVVVLVCLWVIWSLLSTETFSWLK